ncbi:putative ribonuclease H-like domain-containing protein [Tanacetum coccineum]
MSFDDLYNNFKIVEQEVKGTASSSSSSNSQNMAFVSSPSSTNEVNTAYGVSTANTQVSPASTQVSTASTQVSTANLSDDTVYAFLASQPNGSQLVYEDLEQIHEDDIEEMDLKWQLALLSMRTRREYRGPRNQDSRNRNQDSSRRTINVEETSSKAMVAIDGAVLTGAIWQMMKFLQTWLLWLFQTLRIEFNKSEFNLATYKRGLASVEEQLVFYKKNEVIFCEQLVVLKRDISYKDSEISMLKSELEKLKQEKESNQLKIENFDNASKSLDKLIGSQITDKSRKGVGFVSYNVVPPPHTGLFSPPNLDLSYSGLEEFQQPEFEGYGPKTSKSVSEDISNEVRESPDAPLVKELVSDDKLEKKTVFPTVAKIEFVRPKQQEKPVRKPVKYAEMYRSQSPRGNQRNWNNQKSQQLGSDFVMYNKACFVCGSFDHVQADCNYHQRERVGHPQKEDQGYVDSGCSRHMTGNMSYLSDFKEFDGGYVTFGGGAKGGKITSKGTLKTGKLDFEDVYFVKELQFNLFSVSQMCDKKNNVLFTDTGCFVLSPDFKLADESQVLLKVPRKNNMYSVDMKNIVPKESLTCLVAKATLDESMLWHRRLGNIDGKSDEGFFVGYSMNSDGPKWLFDIDVLTKSMNYVPVVAGTNSNDFVGTKESIGTSHSSKETGSSQDYILMPLWKDGSLFDSSSNNANNATLEVTHADFFGDETKVNMINITTTYLVPSTPNTRIHKDYSLDHVLVDLPKGKRAIGTKWVFRNKKDERGIVIWNKARLVVHGHTQEKGIDYDEVFAPVARIEAIRLFLAYDSFMGFMVYQIDMKSAFLYERIREEVYVCQPPGFEDPNYPDKVYKVVKALYGLHQAPIAWYETLAKYLLDNEFHRGKIDHTLFIKKHKGDILLV